MRGCGKITALNNSTNEDLYNYFMGCIWYSPTCDGTDFKDSIFNEYEKANLEILVDLDTY